MDAALQNDPQISLFIFGFPGFDFEVTHYSMRALLAGSLHLQKLRHIVANFHCHSIGNEPFDRIVCYMISHLLIC